jgi:hypothetical protein
MRRDATVIVGSTGDEAARSGMGQQIGDASTPHVRVSGEDEIQATLDDAGLGRGRVVVVLVGGASGMNKKDLDRLARVLQEAVIPILNRYDAVVVDGGTDVGVMRLIGQTRAATDGRFPLVGVAAEGTVVVPGNGPASADAAALEPNHTLFLLVPGTKWGDEALWITQVAGVIAGSQPSVTLLVNGGQIAYTDITNSLNSGRPVVVLAGSGRTADAIAEARAGRGSDPRAVDIATSPLITIADIGHAGAVAAAIDAVLANPQQRSP